MDYTEEDNEDKKYKKGYGKKEFKKDVQEAVEPLMKKKSQDAPPVGRKEEEADEAIRVLQDVRQ